MGRRRTEQDDAPNLGCGTHVRAKGVALDGSAGPASYGSHSRNSSVSDGEHPNAQLCASSMGNTDTVSSSGLSGHSTAMTSATTDDDGPRASSPTSTCAHAHPALTILELVSNSASSSALPDSFDFNVSRKGSFVAVYSASNIWLIKAVQLPRLWARTLQVRRKPVAVDITEDGFVLAVLSRPSQVDLYEMHGERGNRVEKRRTIMLAHEAASVVVSPDARILIAGNKFGIEVVAIGPDAPETARRTLSGPAGDALEFSDDGRTLLITGYARKSDGSALFVLPGLYDGPLTDEGEPIPQPPENAWTGSVLFPETARIARQATLLPDADTGTFNELFAFNAEEDSWGIYDIACQRFTQRKMFLPDHQRWTRSEFVDDAMPAVSPNADLAAVALRMRGTTNIWIYHVPGWEHKASDTARTQPPIQPCFCIPIREDGPDTLQEMCVLRWVRLDANVQRLLAVGNSSVASDACEVPGGPMGSKGIIVMLDFDKRTSASSVAPVPTRQEYDLDPLCPGEPLPEGSIDFEREVELVRTRTMMQRQAQDRRDASRRHSRGGSTPVQRARTVAGRRPMPSPPAADEEELTAEEAQAAFEAPYDNQQPRSHMSLARAATVAAVSPANRRHLRALPLRPLEYRRADGGRDLPHESDADNWVPPPPAYTTTAAAAGSVSLSHPNGPPALARHGSLSSSIPPVPALPGNFSLSQSYSSAPYQNRSRPSIDPAPAPAPPPRERRPSLLHPSTYPNSQSSTSIRRPRSPSFITTTYRTPQTHLQSSSTTPSHRPIRPHSRRAVESSIDLRLLPLTDPLYPRRGSASSMPLPSHTPIHTSLNPNDMRREALPRLVSPRHTNRHGFPMSVPPQQQQQHQHQRVYTGPSGRTSRATTSREKEKKMACVVM